MEKRTIRLGGVRIPCFDVSGEITPALVRHEYPGHDGADVEFQGMGPNGYTMRAVFPAALVDDWNAIKSLVKTGERAILEHFEDGDVECRIESVNPRYDKKSGVEVDIKLVADGISTPPRTARQSAQDVVAGRAQEMADQAVAKLANQILPAALPTPDLDDPDWLEKLGDLGTASNAVVSQVKTALGRIDGVIASVNSPASAALNALAFGADLPSQFAKRVATALDLLQGNVTGAPDPATSAAKFLRDVASLATSLAGGSVEATVRILGAYQGAATVAALMATDEDRLRLMQAYESAQAFDARGRWVGGATLPTQRPASSKQVVALVAQVRTLLQSVRPLVADGSLVDLIAVALQDQYNDRLFEMERVREIYVSAPTPLHLVCHRNGLPYNAAERVILLNPQLRNPTFAQGRILIYAP